MTFSLYQAIVPGTVQMLGSMRGLVDKAQAHCAATGTDPADLLGRRLAPDMLPLAYQFKSTVTHSLGAIEGVQRGRFSPDRTATPDSFGALHDRIGAALDALQAIDPKTVEGFAGRDMVFELGEMRMDFAAEDFLTSFSQPNFYFHCATAYALLRAEGIALGKRDYLGRLRFKAAA